MVLVPASIGGYLEWPACSIGEHLRSQNFYLWARKIHAVLDTHQDSIGYDAPVMSRILPDHNEHGAFEGHGKEDVTSKVSDPPSQIFFKEVTAKKNPCSLDDFLVVELPIKRRTTTL